MALREINLMDPQTLLRIHRLRHLSLWSGCLLLVLSLIFGFYLYETRVVLAKKGALTRLKETQSMRGVKTEEIRRVQKELENLNQQQNVLESIKRDHSYSLILVKLSDIMNESTWLTQLNIETGKDGGGKAGLLLTGFSLSNEELGDFLNRLAHQSMCQSVVLKYSREMEKAPSGPGGGISGKLIQFQTECHISKG